MVPFIKFRLLTNVHLRVTLYILYHAALNEDLNDLVIIREGLPLMHTLTLLAILF
jgi:hypothetical protein